MDDGRDGGESEAFSVCSSPLSTALDTAVLEASFHATDGNTLSFNSEQSNGGYVRVDGKTYLAVGHTANLQKGAKPSWIWNHGEELRLFTGPKPQKSWRCGLYGVIIPAESTTAHAGPSAEYERVFSSAKKMVTAERNRLSEDIIQACECLKAWWDNGFME